MSDLTLGETHFRFGENWANFLRHVDDTAISEAEAGLLALVPQDILGGASFIDIGCGSGLHALAAIRLGAGTVLAVDIDPDSVAATRALLDRYGCAAEVKQESVFDISGHYDVVYSWGVLHHTGDMWRALEKAASLVSPGGTLAIALYERTPSCAAWAKIKRFYSRAPRLLQALIRWPYSGLRLLRIAAGGQSPIRHVREYSRHRGMNFFTDSHDWLGGFPYESASFPEVVSFMESHGFDLATSIRARPSRGLLGAGISQYSFKRRR